MSARLGLVRQEPPHRQFEAVFARGLQRRRAQFRVRRAELRREQSSPAPPCALGSLRMPVELTVGGWCRDVWPCQAGQPGSGGVGFWAGGVSPSGGGDPYEDAGLGLLERPALGLLAAMVPSAEWAETALTRPATGLVRDGVVLIALRGRTAATGSGAAGRPGLDQMPQQPAWLVAWFLVAVITAADGQWGDPDPGVAGGTLWPAGSADQAAQLERPARLPADPGLAHPCFRIIPRRSRPGRFAPPRAVRRWMMRPWAGGRWPIPRWPILRWAFRSSPVRRAAARVRRAAARVRSACRARIRARRPGRAGLLLLRTTVWPGACGRPGQLTGQLRVDWPECRHLTWGV